MGVVYLAHREGDGTPVALKTIMPAVAHSAGTVGRFLREASVLRQLDHPNIVKFREIGQAGDRLYFAMDYVPGTDADGLVKGHRGPLPIARAVGLACQVLDGLAYAHARGFVHRDIKPKNILVDGGRRAGPGEGGRLRPGPAVPQLPPQRPDPHGPGRGDLRVHVPGAGHQLPRGEAAGRPLLHRGDALLPAHRARKSTTSRRTRTSNS